MRILRRDVMTGGVRSQSIILDLDRDKMSSYSYNPIYALNTLSRRFRKGATSHS